MPPMLLRVGLLAGCAYFVCMAIAHYFGIKVPILFVYWDTPFYAYQDKIISFAVIAYVGLFYAAARSLEVVPVALFVLGVTTLGLVSVNLSSDLAGVLSDGQLVWPYWAQTAAIGGYFAVLTMLYTGRARTS